jgi:ADP-ribose pyrophosphatase
VNEPEVLASEEIFHGRIFDVTIDTVREAGQTYTREVVHHPGGAGIVAAFDDGTIALVRQYRHPTVRYVLELPAGRLNEESARKIARRASWKKKSASPPEASKS